MLSSLVSLLVYNNEHFSSGVLEDGTEDFESADDLYEALGTMLTQVAEEKEYGEIREICDRLFHVMKE